jgi:hypothetical protein
MRAAPRWISKKALLLLHELSLTEFGGVPGLRDEGLLDSALARPRNAWAYNNESTLAGLAASYAHGIARNHAFMDGNKRAALLSIACSWASMDTGLSLGQRKPSTRSPPSPKEPSTSRAYLFGSKNIWSRKSND